LKKESFGAGTTLTKTKRSRDGAGAIFMKRITSEPELR